MDLIHQLCQLVNMPDYFHIHFYCCCGCAYGNVLLLSLVASESSVKGSVVFKQSSR